MADVEILVPLGFFALVGYIAWLIADTRVRRKAMEAHASPGVAESILNRKKDTPSTQSALKWGLVVLSLGAALLLIDVLAIGFESPLAYALMLLATGGALLGYYLIERDRAEERAARSSAAPRREAEYESEL